MTIRVPSSNHRICRLFGPANDEEPPAQSRADADLARGGKITAHGTRQISTDGQSQPCPAWICAGLRSTARRARIPSPTCWQEFRSPCRRREYGWCARSSCTEREVRPPDFVNFTALDSKLSRICRRRSASTNAARSAAHPSAVDDLVFNELRADECFQLSKHVGQTHSAGMETHPPRLDLGEVQDVVDQREQVVLVALDAIEVRALRARSPGREFPPRADPLYPPMALSGVRSSCDMLARNSDFALFARLRPRREPVCSASYRRALSMRDRRPRRRCRRRAARRAREHADVARARRTVRRALRRSARITGTAR